MVDATENLIASTAVTFWSFCMWLYPMLFPLGMMGVASTSLGRADQLPLVENLGTFFLAIAV